MSKWLKKFQDMSDVITSNTVPSTLQDEIKPPQDTYVTAESVIRAIYSGKYKGCCLIPVLPAYQDILGQACWVCSNEDKAARKRQLEIELVFTVEEFKLTVESSMQGIENLRAVIATKRTFKGVILCEKN